MKLGIPKEIKQGETRVAATPNTCRRMIDAGATVMVESHAGNRCGYHDDLYKKVGVTIVESAEQIWAESDLVVKVKEPIPVEYDFFRPDLGLFCYLHLAAVPELARRMMSSGVLGIGYETIEGRDGSLPLLKPMSQVAGRLSVQIGVHYLQSNHGGSGVLLGGVPGTAPGHCVVVGTGNSGIQACEMAIGLGARVTVLDVNQSKLDHIDEIYGGRVTTLVATPSNLEEYASDADLLVGAVLIPGARAPQVVHSATVEAMRPGSVIVDIAVDQGGCIETIHPTSHESPIYKEFGVNHYAVPNMPALVGRTSTIALTQATEPYLADFVQKGIEGAMEENPLLRHGINVQDGKLIHPQVRKALENVR